MSFTYDETQLDSSVLYRIRLEIGDTDEDNVLLQDEEINQIIAEVSGFYSRVARCFRLLASKFVHTSYSFTIGRLREDRGSLRDHYLSLAKKYEARSSVPWSGAIYQDDKDAVEDDDSLVASKFQKGMHDYT